MYSLAGLIIIAVMVPVLALIILGVGLVAFIRALRGDSPRQDRRTRDEETELIQEIHHGLIKMEERIGSLETILFDPERKEKNE